MQLVQKLGAVHAKVADEQAQLESGELSGGEAAKSRAANVVARFAHQVPAQGEYLGEMVDQALKNVAFGENEAVGADTRAAQAMRQMTKAEQTSMAGMSDIAQKAASLGYSAGDMGLAMLTGAPALAMGLQSGVRTGYDIAGRGGTGAQQIIGAAGAGAAEGLMSQIPFGKLFKTFNTPVMRKTVGTVLKQAGGQMLTEGAEEATTEVIQLLIDWGVMGDKSTIDQKYNAYLEQNPGDKGKAIANTVLDIFGQVVEAGLAGGLLGGVMGGGASALSPNMSADIDSFTGNMLSENSKKYKSGKTYTNPDAASFAAALAKVMQAETASNVNMAGQTSSLTSLAAEQGQSIAQAQSGAEASTGADTGTYAGITEKLRGSIPQLKNINTVKHLTGNEFRKGDKNLFDQVTDFFTLNNNNVIRPGLGEVVLDRTGVRSSWHHGGGRAKAVTFAAVPEVIAKGVEIDSVPNWKGRGYDSHVFAAPVDIVV